VGDFNLDGIQDLAVGNVDDPVKVLKGNGSSGQGDGTFSYNYTYFCGFRPKGIAVGDFNSDNIQDLATANGGGSDDIGILLGNGGGIGWVWFEEVVRYPLNGEAARDVVIGDFNSDGIQDLATANEYSDNVNTFLGNGSNGQGDGTFTGAENYPAGHYPQAISIGDFNSDGIQDLAVANYGSDNIGILFGLCTF
jgi:hypothetical protein